MGLYNMSSYEMKEQSKKFLKTSYGKLSFCLAYSIPIVCLIFLINVIICGFHCISYFWYYGLFFLGMIIFTIITLVLGSIYYYTKLEKFVELTSTKSKK